MSTRLSFSFAFAFIFSFVSMLSSGYALTAMSEINSPQQLPASIKIEARPHLKKPGVLAVSVSYTIYEPELYKGRVKARGLLTVQCDEKLIADVFLAGSNKGTTYSYHFYLARDAFAESILNLSSSLYEKDGMATIGGGEAIHIHLKNFAGKE